MLAISFGILFAAMKGMDLSIGEVRTVVFLTLIYSGQATIYLIRERKNFWHSRPSFWMLLSTAGVMVSVWIMASKGILMDPISPVLIGGLIAIIGVYFLFLDAVKVRIFRHFHL